MHYLLAFFVALVGVFGKAFQQQNVIHQNYWLVPVVSFLMALCEVLTIGIVVMGNDLWIVLPIGAGGAIGCILSMIAHARIREGK